MSSVDIRDVRKSFGSFEVLHGVSIPTLLRMPAGLENITSGTIPIGDRVVNNVQPKERDIAMVTRDQIEAMSRRSCISKQSSAMVPRMARQRDWCSADGNGISCPIAKSGWSFRSSLRTFMLASPAEFDPCSVNGP